MQIQFISLIDSYELFNREKKRYSKLLHFKPKWIDFHCSFFCFVRICWMWAQCNPTLQSIHSSFFSRFYFRRHLKSIHAVSNWTGHAVHIVCDNRFYKYNANGGQVHHLPRINGRKHNFPILPIFLQWTHNTEKKKYNFIVLSYLNLQMEISFKSIWRNPVKFWRYLYKYVRKII